MWDEQWRSANDRQPHGQVNTPAQAFRVEAVHKLTETLLYKHPACPAAGAVFAGSAGPVGINQGPLDQWRYSQPDQISREQRQQRIEPAGKQVGTQPTDRTDAQRGWRLIRFEGMSLHGCSLPLDQRNALVVPVHQHGNTDTDRQVNAHGDGNHLDGLPGLVEYRAGEQRNHVRIADTGSQRGVLGQV